ncbi:MAG: LysM peptidoglycan-binding domain-containing protein [bacterium]|nr:LysM peptidoglycan-binding domain-containing protein [bacterium]
MRYWLVIGLICVLPFQTFAGEIPQVPSHMEFAGMKLKITESARKEIQKHVNALRASDKYFKIKLDRVNLYFPIIEKVFKDAKLPDDFKYLAIQESALIADAVSSANAVGFWQFKSFTGREVGLRIDDRVDERMNIVSASRGAAKYMKTNNFYYNNWIFALTAYNTGRGGARKFVDESLYGVNKMTIDKKTHWYVKTFLAHKIAFENEIGGPHSKGLKLVEYTKGGGKTISKIAKELGMDVEKLKDYNVWLKRGTVPEDKTYAVILPVQGKLGKQARDVIAKNEKKNTTKETSSSSATTNQTQPKKYPSSLKAGLENASEIYLKINGIPSILARTGDTPETLASKGSIPLHRFKKYNDLAADEKIQPGHLYYLRTKKIISKIPFHIAQSGETIWSISQKYGIKKSRLARLNRIASDAVLKPGQVMWLNIKRPKNLPIEYRDITKEYELGPVVYTNKQPTTTNQVVTETVLSNESDTQESDNSSQNTEITINPDDYDIHTVVAKETLYGISRQYGMSVDEIIEINRIDPYNMTIEIDQKLYVKKQPKPLVEQVTVERDSVTNQVVTTEIKEDTNKAAIDSTALKNITSLPESIKHIVQQGESLYAISRKYGVSVEDLLKWNGLTMDDAINIDQTLKILTSESNPSKETKDKKPKSSEANSDDKFHIVTPGDTLYSIARKYNITVEDLIKWNNKSDPKINIGERLKVEE